MPWDTFSGGGHYYQETLNNAEQNRRAVADWRCQESRRGCAGDCDCSGGTGEESMRG